MLVSASQRPEDLMDAERRQVTVLFTDMVGFTSFSERSGEEAAYTLMRSLSKLMDDAVREQGGVVQGFTGDGIMAVFGAPTAFEDAPLRACRAALLILQRLKTAGSDLEAQHGVRPQLRIGLNTGPAVVGNVQSNADASITVLGDTVNVAARFQALAEAGSVCMTESTYRLVQGMVEAGFAGEHQIKGKSESQKVYRLEAIRHGAARFDAALSRGLTAYVGRDRELETLERRLAETSSGIQVIDIAGEPGIGKSRLLHEFRQRIGKSGAFILLGGCSPEDRQTPFLPFIELVRGSFRVAAGEDQAAVARKLDDGLKVLGLGSAQNLGLLLNLLGLKTPEGSLQGLDGVLIGLRTRDLLRRLLRARCQLSRGIMAIEDLHWIDSASEELLGEIVTSAESLPLMIVHTRRPEYRPPWSEQPNVSHVPLEPLSAGETARIVEATVRRRQSSRRTAAACSGESRRQRLVRRGARELPPRAGLRAPSVRRHRLRRRDGRERTAGKRAIAAHRARRSPRVRRPRPAAGRRRHRPSFRSRSAGSGNRRQRRYRPHRSPSCKRSILSIAKTRPATTSSSTRSCAMRSIAACSAPPGRCCTSKSPTRSSGAAPIVFPKSPRHSRTTTRPLRAPTRLSSTWRWPPRSAWISILWTRRMRYARQALDLLESNPICANDLAVADVMANHIHILYEKSAFLEIKRVARTLHAAA